MFTNTPVCSSLSRREFAMLHAIADGRAEITGSCEPDLFIDGLACCDQSAAHHLAHAGLVRATHPAQVEQRVSAELTTVGSAVLAAHAGTRLAVQPSPGSQEPAYPYSSQPWAA